MHTCPNVQQQRDGRDTNISPTFVWGYNKGEIRHFSVTTPFNLEAGGQRSNSTPGKDSRAMTSYKLFSHSKHQGAILGDI